MAIENDKKIKVIAEIGWNHMGDSILAEDMIRSAAEGGANVAKFQYWDPLHYKVTEEYDPLDEGGLLWNDSTIGIQWPLQNPLVGAKDSKFPVLENIHYNQLPQVY